MLTFQLNDDGRVQAVKPLDNAYGTDLNTVCRADFRSMEQASTIAEGATQVTGELHIAVDSGHFRYPRFDVIRAPAVGDKVSYAFNGDYYPDGEVTGVSKSLRVVTTSTGKRYYRKRQSGSWVHAGTWSLVQGHIDKRNPHF